VDPVEGGVGLGAVDAEVAAARLAAVERDGRDRLRQGV